MEQQLRLTPPPAPDVLAGRLRVIARSMRSHRDDGVSRVVAPSDITDLDDAADVLDAIAERGGEG